MEELQEKHRRGTNEIDDPDRAPTGFSYRAMEQQKRRAAQQQAELKQQQAELQRRETDQLRRFVSQQLVDEEEDDDDSDYDDLLEEDSNDPVLEALRQRRLEEMQQAQLKMARDLALGHGQYRTITQDEFLPESTGSSEFVAIHFFHKDFERCKIMDHHLGIVAPLHTECKFIRIDAEKAPFFVSKLQIRTLPTLIVIRDGKAIDRLTGFEGFSADKSKPDQWETSKLQEWLAKTGAISYKAPPKDLVGEMKRLGLRSRIYHGGMEEYNEDV